MECDYVFKIILIGNTHVGKSCFMERLTGNMFINRHDPTIGVDFRLVFHKTDDDKVIKCHIWDTAGQEQFQSITRSYYKGAAGIIFMFDTTSYRSFQQLPNWYEMVENERGTEDLPLLLIGTKIDKINRTVTREMAEKFAEKHNMIYHEISSYTGENIDKVIPCMADKIKKEIVDMGIESKGVRSYQHIQDVLKEYREPSNRWLNCCLIS